MQISTGFEIDAPFEQVWEALLDLDRVAPCVPGAEIEERVDETTARGRFRVRLGPVTANYRGTITIEEADRERGDVVLRGQGQDTAAGGTATMVIHNHLAGNGETTAVQMETDLKLTGRAAQIGGRRSILQSVADRMVGEFATALRQELSGPQTAPAAPQRDAPERDAPERDAPEPLDAAPLLRGVAADNARYVAGAALLAACVGGALAVRRRRDRG